MEIIALFVCSKNYKVTDGTSTHPQSWVSQDDQQLFKSTMKEFPVYIMGSKTYDQVAEHINPSQPYKRIILTSNPVKYSNNSIPQKLEFTNESAKNLTYRLDREGYRKALFLGGPATFVDFLTEKLISELRLTIEPIELEEGLDLFPPEISLARDFELKSSRQLNDQGTIYNVYTIHK